MALIKELANVLKILGENWLDYGIIKSKIKVAGSLQVLLSDLEKLGFAEKERDKSLTESPWKITKEGKAFLVFFNRDEQEAEKVISNRVVMTVPAKLSKDLIKNYSFINLTKDVYADLFSSAQKSIKILNPYIDASIASFLDKINKSVEIEIITVSGKFSKNNPILERQKTIRPLGVKYLEEFEKDTQIFQLHAKVIIIDSKLIYVGSANFKETSILHNLEAGILSSDEKIIRQYGEIFDFIYKNYAK